MTTCDIDGCEKPTRRKKALWCGMHYFRWYRHGDPLHRTRRTADPIALPPVKVCSICDTAHRCTQPRPSVNHHTHIVHTCLCGYAWHSATSPRPA